MESLHLSITRNYIPGATSHSSSERGDQPPGIAALAQELDGLQITHIREEDTPGISTLVDDLSELQLTEHQAEPTNRRTLATLDEEDDPFGFQTD